MTGAVPTTTWRQRARDATTEEITSVARELVARDGAAGLSLRAVARTLGMAPSALYRYFPSRDALLTALIIEAYDSVGQHVEDAIAAAPRDQTCTAILAGVHAFRSWALSHPHEYGLIYGPPVPGYIAPADTEAPAMRTPKALLVLLKQALANGVVRLPIGDEELPEPVREALGRIEGPGGIEGIEEGLSLAAKAAAHQFWGMLMGMVAGELFCHMPPQLTASGGAFFDFTMRRALLAMGATPTAVAASASPRPA
jgi:AcrR family transcriptional regulator